MIFCLILFQKLNYDYSLNWVCLFIHVGTSTICSYFHLLRTTFDQQRSPLSAVRGKSRLSSWIHCCASDTHTTDFLCSKLFTFAADIIVGRTHKAEKSLSVSVCVVHSTSKEGFNSFVLAMNE